MGSQLSIWSKEEIDVFAPRMKTKRELHKEYSERKLLERVVLSEEEANKYELPLTKEELINTINYHNQVCENIFLNSKQGMIDRIFYHVTIFNLGIPQMLLTSLSQYSKKKQEELSVSDLIVMYKSLCNVLEDQSIKGDNFEKFGEANKMTFFGYKQYLIMEEYFKNII